MNEQLHPRTLKAKPGSLKHVASIPGCVALGCADIGTCELEDGTPVTITWGRNLDLDQQAHYLAATSFVPIHVGSDDGRAELILSEHIAGRLLDMLDLDSQPAT